MKPIVPVVEDVVAHTFFKINHIASVHYENGKYHLHSELVADAKDSKNKSKETSSTFKNETLQNHTLINILSINFFSSYSPKIPIAGILFPASIDGALNTPPPQV